MLKNPSNKLSSSWDFVIPPHTCVYFWGHCKSHGDYILFPLHFRMHVDPHPVFARDLWVIPSGPLMFCALRKIPDGLRGRTRFISRIISHWYVILWEGEMFHDLSEVKLCFGHFRRDCLEGFQCDVAGY